MDLLQRVGGLSETEIGEMMRGSLQHREPGEKTITGKTERRQHLSQIIKRVEADLFDPFCLSNKRKRDLLIYLLWSIGWYNNQEIGNLFGLGYSSISRRVAIMKPKIAKDCGILKRLEEIKSLIKV